MINLNSFNFNEIDFNDNSSPVSKTPSPTNEIQATTQQVFDNLVNDNPMHRGKKRKRKSVSFNSKASVFLIPTAGEFHNAGLADLLWWNGADFSSFKLSVINDCREYKKNNPTSTFLPKEIINILAAEEISQEGIL